MLLNQEEADCLVYLKGLRVVYAAERSLIASGRNQGWGSNLVNFLISHLWKKSILEEKQGRNRNKVLCSVVGNGSAPSDGKKALQDTGFTILLFSMSTFSMRVTVAAYFFPSG